MSDETGMGDVLRRVLDAKDAEIVRLTAEVEGLRKDAERWRFAVAHNFPVRGQNGEWYVVGAADFCGYATQNEAIDAARSKP